MMIIPKRILFVRAKDPHRGKAHTMSSATGPAAAKALYRSLLRAHARHLPQEMRELGDAYIKNEFRLHRNVTKPDQLVGFFREWEAYLDQILMTARAKHSVSAGSIDESKASKSIVSYGKDLPSTAELTEEQLAQLQKLREEATKPRL